VRCTAGSHAMIVGGFRENWGSIVRIDRRMAGDSQAWVVEVLGKMLAQRRGGLVILERGEEACLSDKHLRPLRDRSGIDEMIIIAGYPKDQWHGRT
jgi:hypothetical protein